MIATGTQARNERLSIRRIVPSILRIASGCISFIIGSQRIQGTNIGVFMTRISGRDVLKSYIWDS